MDKRSFILGMVTAFSECVAGGCKRLALSPPMTKKDYAMVEGEARELIGKHGLISYHEKNEDLCCRIDCSIGPVADCRRRREAVRGEDKGGFG